jgi:D-glycero-D-manno-heptose 1,7-bisphosphate phosphatase
MNKKNYKFLVFDRDGTLIKHKPYMFKENDVELLPHVKEGLKILKYFGFKFFLHTNQSGIARGYFKLEDARKCNNKMLELIGLGDNLFEKICIASDFPPSKNSYRKPSPKFGQEIIDQFSMDQSSLCYIGDSISDLETAINLNCIPFGLNTGEFDLIFKIKNTKLRDTKVFKNFKELTNYLIF